MRLVPFRRGVRILHGRHVLSEVLRAPGPTHSVFDVLAAAVSVAAAPGRLAMLGFAGGGMVAPLRALGREDEVRSVDLDLRGARVFRRVCSAWQGELFVERMNAVAFLEEDLPARYAAIVEDLSVQEADGDVQKPRVSFEVLPALIAARLERWGLAVVNLLPSAAWSWREMYQRYRAHFDELAVIHLEGYENRVLLASAELPSARHLSAQLNAALGSIGSRLRGRLVVRTYT